MSPEEFQARIDGLVVQFNGAIKYEPMLVDNPKWTDEECLAFAHKWHAVVIDRLRDPQLRNQWNEGVPYCRNDPATLLAEAGVE